MAVICHPCRNGRHESCPGGTWCPCQHRTDRRPAVRVVSFGPVLHPPHPSWSVVEIKEESNG